MARLTDCILREHAVLALCKATCHRGPFCPDEYCVEVREPIDAIPAAAFIPMDTELSFADYDIEIRHREDPERTYFIVRRKKDERYDLQTGGD